MAPQSRPGGSVLIVDHDPSIRRLISAVLEHAGFRTVGVDDFESAEPMLKTSTFAAIVRDVNLAPAERHRSIQHLAATAPELLRRTVVTTTAASCAETSLAAGTVFAIVGKPFDIDNLIRTVSACARASRQADRRGARRAVSSRQARSESETEGAVNLDSLRRFAMTLPNLQHLLSVPVGGQPEAALRAEMRRTLGELAAALRQAARGEASTRSAAVFHAASSMAAELAAPALARPLLARGRGH
jgi:DNA-binding response OmpR family regulator